MSETTNPTQTDLKKVATKCLKAWTSGDITATRALLDSSVTFTGPLGATVGADEYIEGIKGMVKIVVRVELWHVFGEGEDVCVIYNLLTTQSHARIPAVGWYTIRDGKVLAVRAFFDARPLRGGKAQEVEDTG
jgi:ketosteroid isomerase-like protein